MKDMLLYTSMIVCVITALVLMGLLGGVINSQNYPNVKRAACYCAKPPNKIAELPAEGCTIRVLVIRTDDSSLWIDTKERCE
jgi:hypothetical protein